jgi:hypothetical protein
MAQFPSKEIAQLSYEYRTLGLGYANLGGLLMTMGLPYDSNRHAMMNVMYNHRSAAAPGWCFMGLSVEPQKLNENFDTRDRLVPRAIQAWGRCYPAR